MPINCRRASGLGDVRSLHLTLSHEFLHTGDPRVWVGAKLLGFLLPLAAQVEEQERDGNDGGATRRDSDHSSA